MTIYFFQLFYILILSVFIFKKGSNNSKKKLYLLLIFGMFTMLVAFRAESVGNDTKVYIELYNDIQMSSNLSVYLDRYEIGYVYLNKFFSMFSESSRLLFFITTLFIMYSYSRFIYKYSLIPWLSVFIFFTYRFYDITMVTIRLNIALAIIIISYDYLRKNKLLKFTFMVILASLFHGTAIVFLIAWPIRYTKINKKIGTLIVFLNVFMFLFFDELLLMLFKAFPNYGYYLNSVYLDGNTRIASVIYLLIAILIISLGLISWKASNIKKNDGSEYIVSTGSQDRNEQRDTQLMLLLIVLGTSIVFMSIKFNLLDRVSFYFLVFTIVYLPNSIKNISKHIKNKEKIVLLTYLIIILFLVYSMSIHLLRPNWNNIYPYKFYWQL